MGVVNRLGDQHDVARSLLRGQWPDAHELGEVLALDVIHGEEMVPFMNADLMDGHDVGMLEHRGRRRFRPKAMDELARGQLAAHDQLQRHRSSEAALTRAINDSHSAPGNFIEQFVIREHPGSRSGFRGRLLVVAQDGGKSKREQTIGAFGTGRRQVRAAFRAVRGDSWLHFASKKQTSTS